MLTKAKLFFTNNKKTLIWISTFFCIFFLGFDVSFANDSETNKEVLAKANFLLGMLNIVMKIISAFMSIMTAFVSLFLQPTWVNWGFISLDIYLKEIWRLVANTVYVIFAFLLIVIAFANIIGKGQDKFALKQALPKFIVWVLIVPASWFIVQFMISLSWVLTVSALTIPFETFRTENAETFGAFTTEVEGGKQPLLESLICVKHVINLWEITNAEESIQCKWEVRNPDGTIEYTDPSARISVRQIIYGVDAAGAPNTEESIYSIIWLYTFWIIGIEGLDNIDGYQIVEWWVTDIFAFLWKIILSLIFVVVYFVLLIALFFALFIRILRIWIYIMLSPVFGLMYFFWKGTDKFSFKEFFALIMTPVYVALALSFGFLFMLVSAHGFKNVSETRDADAITTLELWLFEVEITWAGQNSWLKLQDNNWEPVDLAETLKAFKWLGWALWEMIVMIFGIWMFWLAVMAALKQSTITAAIIQPIEQFWTQVWKLAASAPMYAPIIPTGKGWNQSMGSLMRAWNLWIEQIRWSQATRASNFSSAYFGTWSWDVEKAIQQLKITQENSPQAWAAYEKFIWTLKDEGALTKAASSPDLIERLEKLFKDNNLNPNSYKELKVGMTNDKLAEVLWSFEVHIDKKAAPALGIATWALAWKTEDGDIKQSDNLIRRVNGSQTTDHEITKITEWVNITNINNNINESNTDFIALKENIQDAGEWKYSAKEVRKMLSEEITDNKVVNAVMNELDKSIVFRWEANDSSSSDSEDGWGDWGE